MNSYNSHRGADGTFSDDRARGRGNDDAKKDGRKDEAARKDPKQVPAGNPLHSGEHPDPRR